MTVHVCFFLQITVHYCHVAGRGLPATKKEGPPNTGMNAFMSASFLQVTANRAHVAEARSPSSNGNRRIR
jgi:hypothetical protein